MNIYVASSWRNPRQPVIVDALRSAGYEVYDFRNPRGEGPNTGFAWSDIDPEWRTWTPEQYRDALDSPIAQAGFVADFDGLHDCDALVLLLPCGASAHSEAGYVAGLGKPVVPLANAQTEPELMYKLFEPLVTSIPELLTALHDLAARCGHCLSVNPSGEPWPEIDAGLCPDCYRAFADFIDQDTAVEMRDAIEYLLRRMVVETQAPAGDYRSDTLSYHLLATEAYRRLVTAFARASLVDEHLAEMPSLTQPADILRAAAGMERR